MKTFGSQEWVEHEPAHIPAATSKPARTFQQVGGRSPIFMPQGKGASLHDVDGNSSSEDVFAWAPLILGHAHPQVGASFHAQIERGTRFGTPTQHELTWAQTIQKALPSINLLRFVKSGTEATMAAVELAKRHTRRERVLKFQGGSHEWDGPLLTGSPDRPREKSSGHVLLAEYNDLAAVDELLRNYKAEIAAVIVEPLAGNRGVGPPSDAFLKGLRQLCHAHESLLIFDEVRTGLRVADGRAPERFRVTADIPSLGKSLGGGLPIGASGAREDIREAGAPWGWRSEGGTSSANPLWAAAGRAPLHLLEKPSRDEQREPPTKSLCKSIPAPADEVDVPFGLHQVGARFGLFFQDGPVTKLGSGHLADTKAFASFFWEMRQRGVSLPPPPFEVSHLSVVHTSDDIEPTSQAAREAFRGVADLPS